MTQNSNNRAEIQFVVKWTLLVALPLCILMVVDTITQSTTKPGFLPYELYFGGVYLYTVFVALLNNVYNADKTTICAFACVVNSVLVWLLMYAMSWLRKILKGRAMSYRL